MWDRLITMVIKPQDPTGDLKVLVFMDGNGQCGVVTKSRQRMSTPIIALMI